MKLIELSSAMMALYQQQFVDLLIDCVEAGASIGFITPLSREQAAAFWRKIAASVAAGERRILVGIDEQRQVLAGTVQLCLDMPANGQHRAEIAKLMVHPDYRRRGLAYDLMEQAIQLAKSERRSLLVLDTRTGDSAEQLYTKLGFQLAGVIPDYALSTDAELTATSFMYRHLA